MTEDQKRKAEEAAEKADWRKEFTPVEFNGFVEGYVEGAEWAFAQPSAAPEMEFCTQGGGTFITDWPTSMHAAFIAGRNSAQQPQVLAIAVKALKKISFLESFETDAESLIDFARISIGDHFAGMSPDDFLAVVNGPQQSEALAIAVEALEFISDGCLVPPDGGSPRLTDAIQTACEALAKIREAKALGDKNE
jgi:hypothetical protein